MKHLYPIFFIFSFLSAEIHDVSIPENDTASYNYADFRMWVNDSTDTLRGIYWFMHPNNGDSRNIVTDSSYQVLVDSQGFALMGAHIFNMHMNTGIADAVIAAMDSFAVLFSHDELEFVPFFINGYSWGGQFGYHFTKWIPERVVGFITQKGGYHNTDPAGNAIEVPGLMFVGEDDLPYRIENLTGIFLDHRPLGAKWILAMEQGAGHTQITDHPFLDSFFNTVTDLRLPDSMDVFQPIPLNTLTDSLGWFGDQDTWTIGSYECYGGIVDSSSWFPSRNVGERWQNFVSEGTVTDTFDCGQIGAPWAWISDGYQSGTYAPGDTVHIWSALDPTNMIFQEWTGDTSLLDDQDEWHTSFMMPDNDVYFYAHQDTVGPLNFDYEIIQGVENTKNVYSKFPEDPIGTIFFFHGGSGNAEDIIQRVEVIQFFQDAWTAGYGLVITESEDQTLNDPNGDGRTPWLLNPWTAEENIDIGNIQALIDTFITRGKMDEQTSLYSIGVSNGGNFSSVLAHGLNFNAAAMYSAQGNPPELYQVTETPTVFCPTKYDPALGGGNWAAHMNFDTLQSRDIPSAFYELDRSPAYPQRFARIPGIDLSLSNDLFNEFLTMGFIDNDHYFTVLDDSIQYLYMTNPESFSILGTLNIPTVRHVLDQIKVMTADHSFFADFNQRVLSFLSEHSAGPDFWLQQAEIPQGYKYRAGSAPEGHVMVAGTNLDDDMPVLYYSFDDGSSWNNLNGLNNPAAMFQDVILSGDGRIYLPDFAYGVFYSADYGLTWTDAFEFTPEGCAAFGLHSSGVLFAGLTYTGIGFIHRSEDNGATWEAIPLPNYNSNYAVEHIHFNSQGHVFLGTINGIYRSTDVGLTWEQVNYGLNGVQVYSMTIDDQDHIYVLTTQPGLFDGYYRSMDHGSTWETLDWVQDINYALDIVGVDGRIYAINDQTIFITDDVGQTWSELTNGLNQDEAFYLGADLELTPSGYLYAAGKYVHRSSQTVSSPTMGMEPTRVPKQFSFKLFPAYPNPFNPTTTIRFDLEKTSHPISLQIYDITGRIMETLIYEKIESGHHEVQWDASASASGVYFVELRIGKERLVQKLLYIK